MNAIRCYKTFDGKIHERKDKADHHLDVLYGNALGKIASALVSLGKYAKTQEWIDANLDQFVELKKIKDDMVLIKEEED